MSSELGFLYELLGRLAELPGQERALRSYDGRAPWPERGVYFFQEPGQYRGDGASLRVVRVGTHALGAGARSRLWGRLRAHRGSVDGRGNHRGSIFRLHVGASMLRRDRIEAQFPTWGEGQSAPRAVRDTEVAHERSVSAHIGAMPVHWVAVPDDPGPDSARSYIERNAIALLSNQLDPVDAPTPEWLGLHSPRHEIRESGLWNLRHVGDACDPGFLDHFEQFVCAMAQGAR